MSVKSWVLDRVHRINGLAARGDLPAREPVLEDGPQAVPRSGPAGAGQQAADSALPNAAHLGAYAALIGAIRDELEHFVASHVRLHLAIADRDRFLLTSIVVRCRDAGQPHQLLKEFVQEFKPEQVKRYLAREVIGGLPNAAAIDLSQFAGLVHTDDVTDGSDGGGEYRELLEALRSTPTPTTVRPYQVSVMGRWAEVDAVRPAGASTHTSAAGPTGGAAPTTPMAGQRVEFELEDADGRRRVVLQAVVPGRRYVVGKGEGCDIRVNATYASRRHAELWLDNGTWWVADAGSTNGLRVETAGRAATSAAEQPLAVADGARIVLSARADGPAGEYPWLVLRPHAAAAARITPIAAATAAVPKTPLTAILAEPPDELAYKLSAALNSGVRTLELRAAALPVSIGRSRNQTLVVDRHHEGVSGHHLDITGLDDSGVQVLVHGGNGVLVDGVPHGPGSRFHWFAEQTLVLGASPDDHPPCRLTLMRQK
jgi:pSer/pThr/pTyr-binding forkhead associated (FHA) protein